MICRFLDGCERLSPLPRTILRSDFKLDYVNSDGNIANYFPDFFVKVNARLIYIVETKGLEELEPPLKMARLKQWCEDMNQAQSEVRYDFVYVDEESFKKYRPGSFAGLVESFREYKELWQGAGGEG